MKYRQLPRTELKLSEVGFGAWTVGTNWWGHLDESDRLLLLRKAVDLGINFFDTADIYGNGYGEEVLAKALSKERHNLVIASKFGYDIYDPTPRTGHQERTQRFEPDFIRYACEQSLRRLNTDYIDLYQLHNPRMDAIEKEEVFQTLEELVEEGKIRYYGSALGPDIGWFEEGEASMRHRSVYSLQIIYSILEQEPALRFFPIAKEEEVGLISRVPHASEVLTGTFDEPPTFAADDHRSHRKQEWMSKAIEKATLVRFLAEGTGRTIAQAAIKFCLAQETIVSVLPNLTSLDALAEYTAAPDTPDITHEEATRLQELWENNFFLQEEASPIAEGASEA